MGRMEDTRQGERMEKLCHETGRDESEQNQTIRGRGDGNVRPSERIGEGIAGETIPFVPWRNAMIFPFRLSKGIFGYMIIFCYFCII